jgi:hypothetical protein
MNTGGDVESGKVAWLAITDLNQRESIFLARGGHLKWGALNSFSPSSQERSNVMCAVLAEIVVPTRFCHDDVRVR